MSTKEFVKQSNLRGDSIKFPAVEWVLRKFLGKSAQQITRFAAIMIAQGCYRKQEPGKWGQIVTSLRS